MSTVPDHHSTLKPILYAEDEEHDVFFMQRTFEKLRLPNPLVSMPNGEAAVAYLSGEGRYADRQQFPEPALVLLDVKMPGLSGFDVLKWIRSQPRFSTIPVIMLTASNHASDMHRAYLLGANGFITKTTDIDELAQMMTGLHKFWLGHQAPPQGFVDVGNPDAPKKK